MEGLACVPVRVVRPAHVPATEADVFRACTGRAALPGAPFGEAWLVCGRRAGKSFVLALIAVFLACFKSYAEYLGPGERATVMVIATDRKQARVIFRYVAGLLHLPMLASLIEREAAAPCAPPGQSPRASAA